MRNRIKLLLTTLGAAIVLAAVVSSADANRIEVSNQSIRVVWSNLKFVEGGGGGPSATCPVTLEGSFHSKTISKVSGQLIGYITAAALTNASCTFAGGASSVRILNGVEEGATHQTLPWHVRYDSFEGELPAITGIRLQLIGAAFLLTAIGVSCLYQSTTAQPAFGNVLVTAGTVTDLRPRTERLIPKFSGSGLCPGSGRFSAASAATVTGQGNTTAITVTLVQ
jgi:hypothetical protein